MSVASQDTYDQGELEEEIILTLVPATEDLTLEGSTAESLATELQPAASWDTNPSVSRKPHPSLPDILPPIQEVSRNTLWEWCCCHHLSTDGKKVEVYKRLQQCSYSEQICHIPKTSREARLKPIAKKNNKAVIEGPRPRGLKRKREEDESGEEVLTSERESGEEVLTSERESGIVEVLTSERESGIVEVLTSERESVFAAWGRITMRASQPRAENRQPLPSKAEAFLPPVTGYRWCVVHGRQLPANKEGWVCLQMHAGQTWVPDSPQRMVPLFILPACVFPTPGVGDNLLCPECAHSNRKMMRNFERDRRTEKKHKQLRENMPP